MGVIRRLSSEVIDRIAAGEVIERPASVAKELVENAIDAGANHIEIRAHKGGLEAISVSDDGMGMSAEDARLALERHATSKIRDADDLFAIDTLGFRGEALSSVAAVSHLTLTSRRPEEDVGRRLVVTGGELKDDEAVGAPVGTHIEVRDLFFNTPARRKFMRAPATEQAHLVDAAVRCVIGTPKVGLTVSHGERRVLDVPPDHNGQGSAARAAAALRLRQPMFALPSPGKASGIRVSGFFASPEHARRDSKGTWTLVNRRYVRDRTLRAAVLGAFGAILERRRYPVCIIEVEVPPDLVDVNVHPQKLEVRFAESNAIYRAVHGALTSALAVSPWLGTPGVRAASESRIYPAAPGLYPTATGVSERGPPAWAARSATVPGPFLTSHDPWPAGEVGHYVLCRAGTRWYVVDRRAAVERLCADRLRAEMAAGTVSRRSLLFPEPLEPSPQIGQWLDLRWETLTPLGYEIEPVGPGRFAVRAVPEALPADVHVRPLILDVLEIAAAKGGTEAERRERIIALGARHAGLRPFGDEALKDLLLELWQRGLDTTDLAGQPLVQRLDETSLASFFGSRG